MIKAQQRWIDERSLRQFSRNSLLYERRMRKYQMMKRLIKSLLDLKKSLSITRNWIKTDTKKTRNIIRLLARILTIDWFSLRRFLSLLEILRILFNKRLYWLNEYDLIWSTLRLTVMILGFMEHERNRIREISKRVMTKLNNYWK